MKEKIIEAIIKYFHESGDYNGISLYNLLEQFDSEQISMISLLKELISDDTIGLISSRTEMNPHIIRTGFRTKEEQLDSIDEMNMHHTCFYPTKKCLKDKIRENDFSNRPYSKLLALGYPQLEVRHFDLSIIEFYRNDPRYYYEANDIGGSLGVKDEFYETDKIKETDQVLIQSFGFSYNDERKRGLCAFICDLAGLTSEHQLIWQAKELQSGYKPHSAFYNSQVHNVWPKGVPILSAIIREIYTINLITAMIYKKSLFKEDFGEYGEKTPKKWSFLIRPTLDEYNSFINLFDKIISENINKKIFRNMVDQEYEEARKKDDKIIIRQKGSIRMLDEWIRLMCKFPDDTGWTNSINAFKKVRKQRQNPAHKIESDIYDHKYFKLQEEIIDEVWAGLNFLRLVLQHHPKCNTDKLDIPEWQEKNYIYSI